MSTFDVEKFKSLYSICFDEGDHIRACGRDNCRNLIIFLGDAKYGDAASGRMNIDAIISLKRQLLDGEGK